MSFDGKIIIFCAPSGSGKTTIVKHLLQKFPDILGFSISACTRDKRGRNEVHGKDYYFLSPEDFKQRIDNDEFVEWEEVYQGAFYGTLKTEITRNWEMRKHVVLDVDVKGGLSVKRFYKDKVLSIFVKVPSMEELEKRLRERGTETEDAISRRLFKVKFEMSFQDKFDVVLVNDNLEDTLKKAEKLVFDFIAEKQ